MQRAGLTSRPRRAHTSLAALGGAAAAVLTARAVGVGLAAVWAAVVLLQEQVRGFSAVRGQALGA